VMRASAIASLTDPVVEGDTLAASAHDRKENG
jgi:hypothetical protein